MSSSTEIDAESSGSTAVLGLLQGRKLTTAWVGDSRGIVGYRCTRLLSPFICSVCSIVLLYFSLFVLLTCSNTTHLHMPERRPLPSPAHTRMIRNRPCTASPLCPRSTWPAPGRAPSPHPALPPPPPPNCVHRRPGRRERSRGGGPGTSARTTSQRARASASASCCPRAESSARGAPQRGWRLLSLCACARAVAGCCVEQQECG